jgi:hypothetical protein
LFKKIFEQMEATKSRKADKRFAKGPGFFERVDILLHEALDSKKEPHWKNRPDWKPGDSEYPYEKDGSYKRHRPDFVEEKRVRAKNEENNKKRR